MPAARDLIILGTTVHAREMAELVERVNAAAATWKLLGFAAVSDEEARRAGAALDGITVLGGPEALDRHRGAAVVPNRPDLATTDGLDRERLVSLVDPSCFVSRTAVIGRGCVLYPFCFVGRDAVIEDVVFALSGCVINHDDRIGRGTILTSGVQLAGSVTVGPDCYLGQACTVREKLTIGQGSRIGTGAVVIRDVAPRSVMVGNPARLLRSASAAAP